MNLEENEDRTAPIAQSPQNVAARRAESPQSEARPGSQRVEMYRGPHKALRFMLANLLLRMGTTSFEEELETEALLADLDIALYACDEHIAHEDGVLRTALAERAPSMVATLDQEHAQHAQHGAELRALMTALRDTGPADARLELGNTLYLHFSVFVAETLAHMACEERVVQPLLDRLFSTEELMAFHVAIVSSIAPQEMAVFLRAMVPGSNRAERAKLLGEVRLNAPPDAFAAVMADLRPRLSADDWADLSRRLEL